MIKSAKRPLVLVASGASRGMSHDAIREFVDKTGLYFFTTQMGKGVVDERHPRCLGTAALSDGDYIHDAIAKADLILNIGHDVAEKPPFFMKQDGIKVIHLSFFEAQMDDVYFPQHEVIGCMNANIRMLQNELQSGRTWDFDCFKEIEKNIEDHVFAKSEQDSFPNIPQRIVSDVREVTPSDAIVSLDNGMYKIWFARNYPAYEPNTVLLDNALATMGAGLPAAIAAKIVFPNRQVIAICGDGGFMMNSQEIETAIRLKIDLVCIVVRDDAYGMIKWKQAGLNFSDYGLDFGNPDFVAYAEAYGAKGFRIKETGQLTNILKKCFETGGVNIIEVPIDYSENKKTLIDELKDKTLHV